MSMTGLEVFDTTIHKTHTWLKEIMEELNSEDRHQAYLALRAVLHTLRDRLTVEEAAQLGAQLPMLIRGFYYEGWKPASTPLKERRKEEFLGHIFDYFKTTAAFDPDINPEQVTRVVFKVLDRRVTAGEIEDIKHILPPELRELWP